MSLTVCVSPLCAHESSIDPCNTITAVTNAPVKSHANILFFVAFIKEPNLVQRRADPVSLSQIGPELSLCFSLLRFELRAQPVPRGFHHLELSVQFGLTGG